MVGLANWQNELLYKLLGSVCFKAYTKTVMNIFLYSLLEGLGKCSSKWLSYINKH